ncbi:MAG TPA: hypothetical protein VMQ78_11360 [Candidatus Limnocylindria bacterium]|nr:hypothetical protein [Candidatus Limnocylindria bacterium]
MRTTLSLTLAFAVLCAACGASTMPGATTTPSVAVTASNAPSVTATGAATPTAAGAPVLRIGLTDVRTGDPFTLGGFAGRTVIVQGMAVW